MRSANLSLVLALALAPSLWADPKPSVAPAPATQLGAAAGSPAAAKAATTTTGSAAAPANAAPAAPTKPLWVDYTPPDWAKAHKHITWQEAVDWHKKKGYLFCDARAKAEYDQGHIPGAIPLPSGEFDKFYAMHEKKIKNAKWLITYCHGIGCRLSEKAANSLVEKGHKHVAVFFGGWPQWNEHHDKIETGDPYGTAVDLKPSPTIAPASVSATAAPKK